MYSFRDELLALGGVDLLGWVRSEVGIERMDNYPSDGMVGTGVVST